MFQESLFIPDRFDMLQRSYQADLQGIIYPVHETIQYLQSVFMNMGASRRGDFLIFRGEPGSGKSTFLHTLPIFIPAAEIFSIQPHTSIPQALQNSQPVQKDLRVIIIEGREALGETSQQEIETSIHSINQFLRSERGERTIIVWPANTDHLSNILETSAKNVGGDSLLGVNNSQYFFTGPPKESFLQIANNTISVLNQGATLSDLGVSLAAAESIAHRSSTIGQYLGNIRSELLKNRQHVQQLLEYEKCKLWIVVIAGNDPDGDVAALTRSTNASIDIERLLSATGANIVNDLKQYPSQLGILGTVLDAKIIHIPILTALSVSRDFADDNLRAMMSSNGLSTTPSKDSIEKLQSSELAKILLGQSLGVRTRGAKPGSNTVSSFEKLTNIARTNDSALNRALGLALASSGLIQDFDLEVPFKGSTSIRTDLVCNNLQHGNVRIELMWKKKTSRADIANYVLKKLHNYGRNINLLQ